MARIPALLAPALAPVLALVPAGAFAHGAHAPLTGAAHSGLHLLVTGAGAVIAAALVLWIRERGS